MNGNATDRAAGSDGVDRPGWRGRVYALLEDHSSSSNRAGAYAVELFLAAVILVNCTALILWTAPGLRAGYGLLFHIAEYTIIIVLGAEYGLRLWTAPEANPQNAGWRERWRFARSVAALVDVSVLVVSGLGAFWVLIYGYDLNLTFLLAARLLTRSVKLMRYFPAGRRVGRAVREQRGQLLTAVGAMLVALVIASSLMYLAENRAQPEVFASIPAAMWWGMVTLTTVGYGDAVPVTALGRILAAVIAVLGIGLFALPAGIISAGLMETGDDESDKIARSDGMASDGYCRRCRHCARRRRRGTGQNKGRRRISIREPDGVG